MNKLAPEFIASAQQGVVPATLRIAAAMEETALARKVKWTPDLGPVVKV